MQTFEKILRRTDFIVAMVGMLVLLALVAFCANVEIKDYDLWLHLATGRYMVENHTIPLVDVLSCTVPGKLWNNHEWLFQILIYSIYKINGAEGLIYLRLLVITLTFILLLRIGYNRDNMFIPIAVLTLVICVYRVRATVRPDIFSILFFTIYVWLLGFHLDRKIVIGILCVVQLLWVNMHGFFILGPVIVFLSFLSEWLKRSFTLPYEWNQTGRLSSEEYNRTKLILLLAFLACFANPHFIKGALYPFTVLFSLPGESKIFFQEIAELIPPIKFSNLFTPIYWHYKVLILVSFLSFVLNYKRIDMAMLLLWGMFLFSSLKAVRNVVFFSIVAYFVIIANSHTIDLLGKVKMFRNRKLKHLLMIALKLIVIVYSLEYMQTLTYRGYYDFDKHVRKTEYGGGVSLRNFPFKAVSFLRENNVKGNFFNDFNSAAFLLAGMHPDIKVFIDGRTEVYGPEFFKEYVDIQNGNREKFNKAVDKYNLTGVFHNHLYRPVRKGFISFLQNDKDWVLVYLDYDAVIFLKDIPENQEVIAKHRINLEEWSPMNAELIKLGLTRVSPYRQINRAYALYNIDAFDAAKAEIMEGYKIDATDTKVIKLLSKVAIQQKNYMLGFEYARKAKFLDPSDIHPRFLAAKALYYLDDNDMAYTQCQQVLNIKPEQPDALLLMSLILIKRQQFEEARMYLAKGYQNGPDRVQELIEIGDRFFEQKRWAMARDAYQLVLDAKVEEFTEEVKEKIRSCQEHLGQEPDDENLAE